MTAVDTEPPREGDEMVPPMTGAWVQHAPVGDAHSMAGLARDGAQVDTAMPERAVVPDTP